MSCQKAQQRRSPDTKIHVYYKQFKDCSCIFKSNVRLESRKMIGQLYQPDVL